jgi:MbtH protein
MGLYDEEDTIFVVVRNDEDQYALWPQKLPTPAGWHEAGMTGTKEECTRFVDKQWTDMRPASLRAQMDANG